MKFGLYYATTTGVRPSISKMTTTTGSVRITGRSVSAKVADDEADSARRSFPPVVHVCSDPSEDVLPARAFHASRFFSASSSRLASASHAPLVILAHRSVRLLARVSHVLSQIPKPLRLTFRLSLYRFFWPPAERFPSESSP